MKRAIRLLVLGAILDLSSTAFCNPAINVPAGFCSETVRKVSTFASPASMTKITLSNASSEIQKIYVEVNAKSFEQINNAHVSGKFGMCVWNGRGCNWSMPNGSSFSSCDIMYKKCVTNPNGMNLAAGSVKRLSFGSLLNV